MNKEYSVYQLEYIRNAFLANPSNGVDFKHRWNGKVGATQCGKTYVDTDYVIPCRIINRKGIRGLNFIVGVSRGTIERNVLEPMREIYGSSLIGDIGSDNIAVLFGEQVYCIGAEKINQAAKFRGARIKYLYIDEAVDINEEVFNLLKSRLSCECSCCDFTGNPKDPNNFIKRFLDQPDIDIYMQAWTLYMNPFIPASYVQALENEYAGTVFYDRYILGKWVRAEGAIYRRFCDSPSTYISEQRPPVIALRVGVDFGGNGSAHAFVASGYTPNFESLVACDEEILDRELDPNELADEFVKFCRRVYAFYRQPFHVYYDTAEPVLARGLAKAVLTAGLPVKLTGALKSSIIGRIRMETMLLGACRLIIWSGCKRLIKSMQEAVWNPKSLEEERLDDGSYCVDVLDAFEYSFERDVKIIENLCIK
jgi:PBSX family phage terminase large subunit